MNLNVASPIKNCFEVKTVLNKKLFKFRDIMFPSLPNPRKMTIVNAKSFFFDTAPLKSPISIILFLMI